MNPFGLSVVDNSVVTASVVVATDIGQVYEAVPPHWLLDQLKMVAPGHFTSVATRILSVVNAQL